MTRKIPSHGPEEELRHEVAHWQAVWRSIMLAFTTIERKLPSLAELSPIARECFLWSGVGLLNRVNRVAWWRLTRRCGRDALHCGHPRCQQAVAAWILTRRVGRCIDQALEAAVQAGGDPVEAALKAGLHFWSNDLLLLYGRLMERHTTDTGRTEANFALSGFVATKISLKRNRRLGVALDAEGKKSPAQALLERLPGTVRLAWADRTPGEPLAPRSHSRTASLISRVAHLLEADRPTSPGPTDSADEKSALEGHGEEHWAVREEARATLSTLANRAGLSPRETEVLALLLQEEPQVKIAERLGLKEGTVNVLAARLREKLRRAAG